LRVIFVPDSMNALYNHLKMGVLRCGFFFYHALYYIWLW
jgi:hypothetical protein